jgi:hypothetical protein
MEQEAILNLIKSVSGQFLARTKFKPIHDEMVKNLRALIAKEELLDFEGLDGSLGLELARLVYHLYELEAHGIIPAVAELYGDRLRRLTTKANFSDSTVSKIGKVLNQIELIGINVSDAEGVSEDAQELEEE